MRRSFDPRFVALLKKQKRFIVIGLACAFFASLINLATASFIEWTINATTEGNRWLLARVCVLVVVLFSIKYFFSRGQTLYLTMAGHRVAADLRKQIFRKLHYLPVSFFNDKKTGALQSIITNDVNVVQSGVPLVRDVVDSPILTFGGLLYLFYFNWQLALATLVAVPPVAIAILLNGRKVRKAQAIVQKSIGDMTAMMQESLSAARTVKSFTAEEREIARFEGHINETLNSNYRVVRLFATLKPLVELLGSIAVAFTLWLGGTLVSNGSMTVGQLMAFIFVVDRVVRGATGLANMNNIYSQVLAATDRIFREVLDVETDVPEDKDAITLPSVKGDIEFSNVSFCYPDGTQALSGVSFKIKSGTCTALVGRSGAGKSTIADLLLRFYDPILGTITLDGVDLRKLNSHWLRQQIGVVPQNTMLFAGTIRENIVFGKPSATDEEVKEASCLAHAEHFIQNSEHGYETLLGERGIRLSGGEAQRIAIARALLVKPAILLLDEATSSLDAINEKLVQEALSEAMHGRTTLMIAHRLSTAARADQIILLNQGKIEEIGSHIELMQQNGAYASMYRAFSSGLLEDRIE